MRPPLFLPVLLLASAAHAGTCSIYKEFTAPKEVYSGFAGYVDGTKVWRAYDSYKDAYTDLAGHIDGSSVWRNYSSYKDAYSDFLGCVDGDVVRVSCRDGRWDDRSPLGYFWNGRVWRTRTVDRKGDVSHSDSRAVPKGACSPGEVLAAALILGLL